MMLDYLERAARKPRKLIPVSPLQHLQNADPILGAAIVRVIEVVGPLEDQTSQGEDHFAALCRIVVGQQLSTTVARAIWGRVLEQFDGSPTPAAIAAATHEQLRAPGLSGAKARTLHALAAHVGQGQLDIAHLETLGDAEIAREIIAVKGLGPWSADMFTMFHLNRPDILPVGDLGIREAARRLYGLDERPDAARLTQIAEAWRPHRTLACRYLWRFLDVR